MRKFNLVKSLTRVMNNSKGLLILCLITSTFGVEGVWGQKIAYAYAYPNTSNLSDANNKSLANGITTYGGVYVSVNDGTPTTDGEYKLFDSSTKKNVINVTAYYKAKAASGYSFIAWYSDSKFSSEVSKDNPYSVKFGGTGKQEKWCYAKFAPITYSITYDGVPSGVTNPNPTNYTIESETITFSSLTRTGYTFKGWNPASIAKGNTGDKTITASWTANKYNVTYDAQEGLIEGKSFKTIEETYDGKYTCPIPTREGYDFQGWFTETSGGGSKITTNSTVQTAEEHTLYAHWQMVNVVVKPADEAKTVNFTNQTETLTTTLTFSVENATSATNFNTPTSSNAEWKVTDYSYSNNVVTVTLSFTATENVTTRGDHSSTITLTAKNNVSATGTVTAHIAMTPVYTCTIADEYWVDDNAIDLNTLWTSSSNGAKHYERTSFTPSGSNNEGATAPAINGTTLSLGQAGTVNLKLTQEAGTSSVAGTEQSKTITIRKRDNTISSSFANSMYMGTTQDGTISSNNSVTPITATQTAGEDIATLNDAKTQITSHANLGTATWTLTQPENYKYKAANAMQTVNVVKQAEATDCYVLDEPAEWKDNYSGSKEYNLTGPGDVLTLNVWKAEAATYGLYIKQYVGNSEVKTIEYNNSALTTSPVKKTITLEDNVTKIVVQSTGGTLKKHCSNVLVTRKTYLTAADVTVDKNENQNPVHPGETGVNNLVINYSLANGGDLKVTWDNDLFTIDNHSSNEIINLGDKGCSNGTATLEIKYASVNPGTHVANVVIYNNVYRTQMTITGTTVKRDQEIGWNISDVMFIGQTESAAATSTLGNVTYVSDHPEYIRVDNDDNGNPTILVAVGVGEAEITATSQGDDEYNNASITKTIKSTNQKIQFIVWNQSLYGLNINDPDIPLVAYATQPDSLHCLTGGQRKITYQSADESVVTIVDGNKLHIVGAGITTVTASQKGGIDQDGHDFIKVSLEKTIIVRDPNAPCENYVYVNNSEVKFDLGWNAASHQTKTQEIDFGGQEPDIVSFDYKGEAHHVLFDYYAGSLRVDQFVNGAWKEVKNLGQPAKNGNYVNTGNILLDRYATKMRVRAEDGMGYMYFKNCKVTLARYIETSPLNTFETKVLSPVKQTLTVNYSNISDQLTFSLPENTSFSINKTSEAGWCGAVGSTTIEITYAPKQIAVGETVDLTISDGKISTKVTLRGNATATPLHIDWNIPDENICYTIQSVNLSAKALTDLNVEVPNFVWFSLAQNSTTGNVNGNTLSFTKAGKAIVAAQTTGDQRFTPAATVFKSWTVNLTPTEIITDPEIDGDIVYDTQLSSLKLKEGVGVARNTVNQQTVEGTFAITSGDISTAGEHTVTVTFTPANTNMYASCTKDISVTVLKATPDATASAGNIVYGATVESSVLTNTGTTEGTWAWNDEKNKQVLAVGTYEGLKVHFTPTDQTNYNEIDGTVSLTITAATPTLTWTAKAETAQVHEKKTFTASSTNTDNTAAITYSIISGDDYATIDASTGEVTMLKAGTITVQASQAATTNFAAATSITTTCTISKAPTEITTEPQIDGDIVYGALLSDLQLKANTGVAQNTVNQQAVDGTFAITSGDISTAGQHTVTVTFTPTNKDMYASCTKDISVTVQKANPDATPKAGDITYGQKVNESTLTNEGATEGTWAWTDDKKEQVLEVGTHEGLKVRFTPTDPTNYNEKDGTVSLTVKKAAATLSWTSAPTEADVKDQLTYIATSNHSESAITYAITEGNDYATIDATTGVLTITKAGTITVQASQTATDNYEEATISVNTTLSGEFETVFIGNGDWNDLNNWTHGLPTSSNPDVVISGNMTIDESISVGSLTIEEGGSVTIIVKGDLTVNGTSKERDAYGDLFVHNGGNVTIGSEASVTVHDFVIEASIGTQDGTSQSGQVDNGNNVIYTNGAYIDINMDPSGNVDPAQWYGFTVPFQVDAKNGVSRKEGDIFRPCTYGVDYMIAEYDMNQRLSTGKGWKFISDYTLQAGHFYYLTIDGTYNTYRFKAKNDKITIEHQTTLTTNGTGANANWNAVGNTTLTYATISGDDLPQFVQTYINGQSCYQVVYTQDAQFVVGCPFFFQATKDNTTMVLSKPTGTASAHYAPRQTDRPICVRIAEEGKRFSDQMYITASEDAQGQYQMGRDLAKAGIGTKSAQLWINAYNQQLCVNDAPLVANQAFYDMSLFIPKAGNYEISLPTIPTNGTLYLTQNGYPIWNLNDAPYVLELGKGTISEYGLMFEATQAAAPTDAQTISGNDNAQKILKEQSIYIYKNGNIFNVTGQKVK